MTPAKPPTVRRADALSRIRIVEAAIVILDAEGGGGDRDLTLRGLMAHLATGSGAIYHHVANMDELRAAAADEVLRGSLDAIPADAEPNDALRAVALGIFDSILHHAWIGTQLARSPFQPAVLLIWKSIGAQLQRLGLNGAAASNAGSTLASYILGSAAQQAVRPSGATGVDERTEYLEMLAEAWTSMDGDALTHDIAAQLPAHDDRQQFQDGIDIILNGIAAIPG